MLFLICIILFAESANPAFCLPFFKKKKPVNQEIKPVPIEYKVEYYNKFPGYTDLNIIGIEQQRQILSLGVISPDMTKLAFSEVYLYPNNRQTYCRVLYDDLQFSAPLPMPEGSPNDPNSGSIVNATSDGNKVVEYNDFEQFGSGNNVPKWEEIERILKVKTKEYPGKPIMQSGYNSYDEEIFRTMTIIDWSYNGQKLLVKETTGKYDEGFWMTHVWVYDFEKQRAKKLDEVYKAVKFYWQKQQKLDLNDYRWNLVPLGWDFKDNERILVNAYGYNDKGRIFLGCWSVDYDGERTEVVSFDDESVPVAKYGLRIKLINEK